MRRGVARAAVAVALGAVAAFASAPFLGAVVGGAVGGLQSLAGHAGHAFADDQGAWTILPAFQVGLFAAFWIAVAGGGLVRVVAVRAGRRRRRRSGEAAFGVPVDELARHYGFNPHVGLLRGWALALPAAAVWWLTRPEALRMLVRSAPPRALPQAG